MARTKASVGAKVSAGKSSKARCSVPAPSSSSSSSGGGDKSSRSHSGGNPMCPRETPKWQKPITNFFICKDGPADSSLSDEGEPSAGSSKPKPKRNVIHSDEENCNEDTDDVEPTPNNTDNDEPNNNNKSDSEQQTDDQNNNNEVIEKPINRVLDETLELEPLIGENSHKIDEYYSNKTKGKGIGKKTKGKENLDVNERRNSTKRDLEDVTVDEEISHASKKVKLN